MQKTIVMILSAGRSGSTLLDKSIGSHPRCFSLGEIANISEEFAIKETTHCGCGEKLDNCQYWKKVAKNLQKKTNLNIKEDSYSFDIKFKNKGKILNQLRDFSIFVDKTDKMIIRNNEILYDTIFETTGKSLLIDSTKSINRALLIKKQLPNYRIFFIHLIRNGLAVLNSTQKGYYHLTKADPVTGGFTTQKYKSAKDNVNKVINGWVKLNYKCMLLLKFIENKNKSFIRYEDFVQNPKFHLNNLCKKLGINYSNNMEELKNDHNHIIGGNSSRINATKIHKTITNEYKHLTNEQVKIFKKKAAFLRKYL